MEAAASLGELLGSTFDQPLLTDQHVLLGAELVEGLAQGVAEPAVPLIVVHSLRPAEGPELGLEVGAETLQPPQPPCDDSLSDCGCGLGRLEWSYDYALRIGAVEEPGAEARTGRCAVLDQPPLDLAQQDLSHALEHPSVRDPPGEDRRYSM